MEKNRFKMELYASNSNDYDFYAESEITDFYLDECDLDLFDTNDNKTVLD